MTIRSVRFRSPGERDWGLDPMDPGHSWRILWDGALDAARHARLWVARSRVQQELAARNGLRIALGSGPHPPAGWVGLDLHRRGHDVYRADLRLALPIESATVDACLAEHVLEHLEFDDVMRLLAEIQRVLRPGGVLRIVSPDARTLARLVLSGPEATSSAEVEFDVALHRWPDDGLQWARSINRVSHQWGEHRALLSPEMLQQALANLGFESIQEVPVGTTYHLDSVPDIHAGRFPDEPASAAFSLEAVRGR